MIVALCWLLISLDASVQSLSLPKLGWCNSLSSLNSRNSYCLFSPTVSSNQESSVLSASSRASSCNAKRLAAYSVTNEAVVHSTKIISTEAFRISGLKILASKPIVTIASVPAAEACVRPNMSCRSSACSLKLICASQEANHLPVSLVVIITTAMMIVVQLLHSKEMLIIIPTPMRNSGTNRLLPTKLIRCMTGLKFGTCRLSATPQRKAPRMPSSSDQSASRAEQTIIVITIRKPLISSDQRLKNRCASHGKTMRITPNVNAMRPTIHQVPISAPKTLFRTIASTNNDSVMVSIEPPTEILTAAFFCTP